MVDQSQDTAQGAFTEYINYPIIPQEQVGDPTDPLSLDIDDDELVKIIDDRIDASKKFYAEKYDLMNRRKKNETYYFGRQIVERERRNDLKPYEARNLDNVLYEIEATLKPLAMSHLPDMMVIPGNNQPQTQQEAMDLSKVIDSDIKKRENRRILGMAFKHLPVYFTGIIKARWNPQLGKTGDYQFEVVHPNNVVFDHTSPTNNADDMSFVAQALPLTVQDMIMRFPDKKQEIFDALKDKGLMVGDHIEPDWTEMATNIKIWEVWATWYKKPDASDEEQETGTEQEASETPAEEDSENEWDRIELVIWKFDDVILKKMKNPNYDYEGDEQVFTYDDPGDEQTKRPVGENDALGYLVTGQLPPSMAKEQVYHNYFEMPKKPFFFMGYDQWHKQPLDETSRIEQNVRNQQSLDSLGKQIQETLQTRTKHVFSKDGGLKPDDIERMDMNDPNQDILVEGDVTKVHEIIPADRPSPAEFNELDLTRQRMYSLSGSTAVQGKLQTDVATSNQIAREADYTRADDLVEDTINAAAEWMSCWVMQFIKLRYTEDHFRKLMGDKGQVLFTKLNRDMISDGMEVMIKASGTDKLKAQNNAMQMAQMQMIDPLQFNKDMDLDDPEGRAMQLMMFKTDPSSYITKYLMGMDSTSQQVDGLLGQGATQALQGGTPPPGMQPPPQAGPLGTVPSAPQGMPQGPTPVNTANAPVLPPVGAPMGSPRGL